MSLFHDQMNRSIFLEKPPLRIVSIVPSQTELLFDLGLGDRVVGITKFCIHPHQWYRQKKRIGGTKNLNIEQIKQLKPDLIIGNKEENTATDIIELEQFFPVWMSDIYTLQDVYLMINSIGQLLDVAQASQELIYKMQTAFKEIEDTRHLQKKLKTLYFIWQDPYMVAAQNTFIDHVLKLAGLDNAASHLQRYPTLTKNTIHALEPELILLSSEPYPFKQKHLQYFSNLYEKVPVHIVDGELFSWYGSRLLQTPAYLKKLRLKLADLT